MSLIAEGDRSFLHENEGCPNVCHISLRNSSTHTEVSGPPVLVPSTMDYRRALPVSLQSAVCPTSTGVLVPLFSVLVL